MAAVTLESVARQVQHLTAAVDGLRSDMESVLASLGRLETSTFRHELEVRSAVAELQAGEDRSAERRAVARRRRDEQAH